MTDPSVLNAIWNIPNIIDTFDTLPTNLKSYLIFQLLKRSTSRSLKFVNSLILTTLKRDILASLPHELALQVLLYLDARSLCRAATVSRTWRDIVDQDKTIWRSLMDKDNLNNDNDTKSTYWTHLSANGSNKSTRDTTLDGGEPMDIDEEDKTKTRQLSPINNPYKNNYRERYILRDNWQHGRFKRISFPGHISPVGPSVVTCLQFDDDKIISGVDDRVINIYETKTGKHLSTLRGHEGGVWALQYIGNILVSGSTDRTIRVWDLERAVCTHVFLGHTSTVRCLQIVMPTLIDGELQPKHPLIITGSRDSTLRVWRLPDPKTDPPFDGNGVNPWYMYTLTSHTLSVRTITTHGNTLISGSYDSTVNVWNLNTGRLVHRMEGHSQKVYAVVIDPERKRCISGSMDGSIRVWDYTSGQCLQILEGHSILVGLLGLSTHYLVSGAADGTVRVWDAERGTCQHVLSGHDGAITCVQHDAQKVISGAEGGLKLWDIKSGRLIKDLITGVTGVWRTAFDEKRCVAAVYRNNVTSFEVLDFSAYEMDSSDNQAIK
ncbi:WD40-repeat-containing domain protein [Chlamydoabsidia padenii]|nr:WD40-repeat-containing domain protein [Chlamydoabsidia padenii]